MVARVQSFSSQLKTLSMSLFSVNAGSDVINKKRKEHNQQVNVEAILNFFLVHFLILAHHVKQAVIL